MVYLLSGHPAVSDRLLLGCDRARLGGGAASPSSARPTGPRPDSPGLLALWRLRTRPRLTDARRGGPASGRKTSEGGWLRRRIAWLTDASSWRQVAAALALTGDGDWLRGGCVGVVGRPGPRRPARLQLGPSPGWGRRVRLASTAPLTMVVAVAVGVVLLLNAPYVTRSMAGVQVWVDRKLLGPSRRSLAARVGELELSRSRMVVAADTDRRRIERDLHDGAQARLVSLAMELGRAKAHFDDDPERAKELLNQAHENAKTALVELRGLVRGVHPPVLSDRGLDAALSGLAAICPVPVTSK